MKPEKRTLYAAAITLSKGKMFEYRVPETSHLALPDELDLEMQFPMAIGTIGDFASETVSAAAGSPTSGATPLAEVVFSAQVLQAFDESRLNKRLSYDLRLLAAAGFYLGDVPGNATVQISRLGQFSTRTGDPLAVAATAALDEPWERRYIVESPHAVPLLSALRDHFSLGEGGERVIEAINGLRTWAYKSASAHDLLMADIFAAVSFTRVAKSAWTLLPEFSGLSRDKWAPYLSRTTAIKELWPSQRLLGGAGLYKGQSGIVQMPTSTGKSRATELIIRSAFLATRTKLALVIAPFRALCHEIASDLDRVFKQDGYNVNQISDALQQDSAVDVFEVGINSNPQVVVLTPEKLLYLVRQDPAIVENAGLIVYDEGHQFDTGIRGVTYELLLTSIKRILPPGAQNVLISAVIQNAAAVAKWLLQDESRVVSDKSLQTRRLIAFASLPLGRDGQLQFNVASDGEQRFFVPRVIVREKQPRLGREKKDRVFPTEESGSIALYLGLRLVENGGVAIFAGRKTSAVKIVRDAVEETFRRGISLEPPSNHSDPNEISRFVHLYEQSFGSDSYLTRAAALGIFPHHGNTPQGIRLAIEGAMRKGLIRLVVCTSTLAQGVNLPIRYLLVTSPMQGRAAIKSRDFHNLMGRAGRAGMYGEGTVIFTDHRLYDERATVPDRWNQLLSLIRPESSEPTGSSLLSLFDPLTNDPGNRFLSNPGPADIARNIVDNWEGLYAVVGNYPSALEGQKFSAESLRMQLEAKKRIIEAIEGFLMTYRGELDSQAFVTNSRSIATETLAYSLATPEQQIFLADIFESVARRIERLVPDRSDQQRFGRTLLGIDHAKAIDDWVMENVEELEEVVSADDLFEALWPILSKLSRDKQVLDAEPEFAIRSLAKGWLAGSPFADLLLELDNLGATYPYGTRHRRFDVDGVVELCENTFGFEFALLLSAVKESYVARTGKDAGEHFNSIANLLQKRLKYGLPSQECIAYYEAGFSERVVAQALVKSIFFEMAKSAYDVRRIAQDQSEELADVLSAFPSHFIDVLNNMRVPQSN